MRNALHVPRPTASRAPGDRLTRAQETRRCNSCPAIEDFALLGRLDRPLALETARRGPADERPGEPGAPAGEHVARIVDAEVDATHADEGAQQEGEGDEVDLERPRLDE